MTAHVSAAQAARMYGRSDKTVRRWIRAGKLRADMQDGAYSVSLDDLSALLGTVSARASAHGPYHGTDPGTDTGPPMPEGDVRPPDPPGTDIMRAEAMAAYTRSVLEPLVTALERSQTRVSELERAMGALQAENEALRASQSSLEPSTAAQAPDPSTWPFPAEGAPDAPVADTSWWRRWLLAVYG